MHHRPLVPLALTLLLTACGQDPPASGSGAPVPTATAGAKATATATAAASATAAPTATATATAVAAPAPLSAEPSVEDWEAAKIDLTLVKGGDQTGCFGRRIREWIRVGCSAGQSKNGTPVAVQVVKGFLPSKISILKERNGSIMLVFPAQAGMDGEASFLFEEGAFRLTAKWPAGQPEPNPIASFESAPSPAARESATVTMTDPLPDEPALEGAPALKDWAAAKEVGVKGSSAVGCETRLSGDWFRMVCRQSSGTGKAVSGAAISGFDPKKGYVVSGKGATVVVTQFVKGSDIAVDLAWEKTFGRVNLLWPKDMSRTPAVLGEIVTRL
ncbi:MAG: hypothetical protein IPK82_34830 [Polyangiaceae bacterium]|nr:hypothetical protein [Polyangiaceae bacterium]